MINKKYWLWVVFIIIPFLNLTGQSKIDSLQNELKKNPNNPGLLNDLAEALIENSPAESDSLAMLALSKAQSEKNVSEEARACTNVVNAAWQNSDFTKIMKYTKIAASLYEQMDNPVEVARCLNDGALAAYETDHYREAIQNYQQSIKILLEIDDRENIPSVLINMGQVYEKMGLYDSSIYYLHQAIPLCQEAGFENELSAAYGNLGLIYKIMGNYKSALEYYTKSYKISLSLKNKDAVATDLNNIAAVYVHWENYPMAREYFRQSLDIYQQNGSSDKVEVTLSNLATIYQKEGNYDSAIILFREALTIARKLDRTGSIAIKLSNMGVVFHEIGNYDSALVYQNEALILSQNLGRVFPVCVALQNLGEIYLAKKDFNKALEYFDEALLCAEGIRANTILEKIYKSRSLLFQKMGNYKPALEAHQKYMAFKDSLFTREGREKLAEMEAIYQNEKKQQQIEILIKDKALHETNLRKKQITLYWIGSGALILLLAAIIISWLLAQKNKANKMLVRKNMELMKQEEYEEMAGYTKNSLNISDEEKLRLIADLNTLIKKEKIFTQKQLTLADLAQNLSTNTAYLSHIINEHYNDTFPNFINHLRIKEAQKLFAGNKHKTMTIEGIAESVGFHSRSAFNVCFKKFSGVTPTVFIENFEKVSKAE